MPTIIVSILSATGETVSQSCTTSAAAMEACRLMHEAHGGIPKVAIVPDAEPAAEVVPVAEPERPITLPAPADPEPTPAEVVPAAEPAAAPVYSTWTTQVINPAAKSRLEATHSALSAAGVKVDTSQQYYATGTRMAAEGYATQARRAQEHAAAMPLRDCADALRSAVLSEKREDRRVTARDFAEALRVDQKITAFGLTLTEQSLRGLLASRLESPALGYVLGLRDRIATEARKGEARNRHSIAADKCRIADILRHECMHAPDAVLKLRTRTAQGDIFAIVSESYTPADAPEVLADLVRQLPSEAKGTWSYDPASTSWELRASIWTPTPVAEQAVGEPFEGYVSFQARDNGTGRFRGGGGVEMLRCLNASTYTADGAATSRVHRGRVRHDIDAMVRCAVKSIDALAQIWGKARAEVVPVPAGVPFSQAVPGFWRAILTERKGELVGVLPGRTETHAQKLALTYESERRDHSAVTRADLAQGFTKYIQGQPAPVRRDAETAIASWLARQAPIGCEVRAMG